MIGSLRANREDEQGMSFDRGRRGERGGRGRDKRDGFGDDNFGGGGFGGGFEDRGGFGGGGRGGFVAGGRRLKISRSSSRDPITFDVTDRAALANLCS
ncbi:hypothetical protein, partial [Sphingomonas trueperi]|uniref:hypothetical protein n=1 Tax=Sphingomonas trueperi TaxID=53317 RepID=UPI0031D4982C